jgi:hypothetical protein
MCLLKVSEVDKWVFLSLISRLNDEYTKQAVLSKVEEMALIEPKRNGRARRTVDLAKLSGAGRHESNSTRSAAEIANSVPAGKLKSTLDCIDGYHGVELAKEDRHKTTFATEWGLF